MNTYSFTQYARLALSDKATAAKAHLARNYDNYMTAASAAVIAILAVDIQEALIESELLNDAADAVDQYLTKY